VTPFAVVVLLAIAASACAWLASLVSGDTSWVDRLWSILPVAYAWVFACAARLGNIRLDVMAGLASVWGARLTFNLARKGGYSGVEDYRWTVLRARMRPWRFQLFNLFFIVIYQNVLLVLISLPSRTAYEHGTTAFGPLDLIVTVLFLACTFGETVADGQQWRFQEQKRREREAGRRPRREFLTSGLFALSRHPNYFFEIAQWWLFFLFAAIAAGSLAQPTILGAVLLSALFVGSTRFTEGITLSRYPQYARYQRRTPALIPRPWRRRADADAGLEQPSRRSTQR